MQDLTYILLEKLNIKNIDKEEFIFQIKSHPSFPSLHAITGVLNHFNIENIALNIPVNKENLTQLPKHFLAQINHEKIKKIVLVSKDNMVYDVTFPDNKKLKYGIDEFQKIFTGIIVAAEKDENLMPVESSKSKMHIILWISILTIFIVAWIAFKPDILSSILLITSLIGIIISIAILKKELGLQTTLGNAFCSGENKKNDCDTVINSKEAKIFNFIKLSDASFIYFTGLSLLIFLTGITTKNLSIPYSIILLAILITFYSIYYQYYVIKAWCGLCLSILGVLWLQAILVLTNSSITSFSFRSQEVMLAAVSFAGIISLWYYLRPMLESIFELKNEKIKFFKFKKNFNLFNNLLKNQNKINIDLPNNNQSEIIFGNKKGLPITIITNPFCGHCKEVHKMMDDILKSKFKNLVKIIIRFNINTRDTNTGIVKITSRLLEVIETQGEDSAHEAMNDIYGRKNPKDWFEKWGEPIEPNKYIEILKEESEWCQSYNINFTPEILINGRAFPKEYERNDLKFFLEDLYDDFMGNKIL